MENFEKWLDGILQNNLPDCVIAINFNLYDDGDYQWSIEMVGTGSFDPENSDWACNEEFNTRNNLQEWIEEAAWQDILQKSTEMIQKYLETGRYAKKLKSYQGVGVGFVDGDINIVYRQ